MDTLVDFKQRQRGGGEVERAGNSGHETPLPPTYTQRHTHSPHPKYTFIGKAISTVRIVASYWRETGFNMVWRWLSLVLLVAAALAAPATEGDGKVRFDGFRVYRVRPTSEEQVAFLKQLERQDNGLSFWTQPVLNGDVDIMESKNLNINFQNLAKDRGLKAEVFIEDVQKLIDQENLSTRALSDFGWTAYYPLSTVNAWLQSVADLYPDNVELITSGTTNEGRPLRGVKISSGKEGNKKIFVESGIHAREWITGATATYLINKLLTSKNPNITNIYENFDWYIVPITNPDGYEYTHTHNRLWRKTRSIGDTCNGADPNRNWDYEWDDDAGSSDNECSETYRGRAAFSELETKTLSEYLTDLQKDNNLLVYFCLHSYSQVLMIPYGLPNDVADNEEDLDTIGEEAINVIAQRNGTSYGYGNIYTAIKYKASGGSMDWVKKKLQVKYTYEWELRDKGRYGFLLPASQIVDTAEETIDSMAYILGEVQKREGLIGSE